MKIEVDFIDVYGIHERGFGPDGHLGRIAGEFFGSFHHLGHHGERVGIEFFVPGIVVGLNYGYVQGGAFVGIDSTFQTQGHEVQSYEHEGREY